MRKQQEAPDSEWMWPREVAERFGVSTVTVTRWADDGLIPVYTLPSGHRRYRRTDIDRLLPGASA